MPLDSFVSLGRSGLRVSPFCLGAMTFGDDLGWGCDAAESHRLTAAYLDRGGNFIDTANIYTNGHSEQIVGEFFAGRSGLRDRVVVGTKFFGNLFVGDPNGGGAGRKAVLAQCEDSLRRLRMDYVDVYWLHNWDRYTPIEETLRALDDLVTAGKVRYVGISDLPAWKAAEAHTVARLRGFAPIIAMQVEYSLLERTVEGELLPMARDLGVGVMPWSPLRSGFLSGKYSRKNTGPVDTTRTALVGGPSDRDYDVIDVVEEVAGEIGATPAAVALAWVHNRPGVTSTLIGARRMAQLEDNLNAIDTTLTAEQIARLDAVSTPTLNFPAHNNRELAPVLGYGGAIIDGVANTVSPLLLANPARY